MPNSKDYNDLPNDLLDNYNNLHYTPENELTYNDIKYFPVVINMISDFGELNNEGFDIQNYPFIKYLEDNVYKRDDIIYLNSILKDEYENNITDADIKSILDENDTNTLKKLFFICDIMEVGSLYDGPMIWIGLLNHFFDLATIDKKLTNKREILYHINKIICDDEYEYIDCNNSNYVNDANDTFVYHDIENAIFGVGIKNNIRYRLYN